MSSLYSIDHPFYEHFTIKVEYDSAGKPRLRVFDWRSGVAVDKDPKYLSRIRRRLEEHMAEIDNMMGLFEEEEGEVDI